VPVNCRIRSRGSAVRSARSDVAKKVSVDMRVSNRTVRQLSDYPNLAPAVSRLVDMKMNIAHEGRVRSDKKRQN
jgi:hypothetical protein